MCLLLVNAPAAFWGSFCWVAYHRTDVARRVGRRVCVCKAVIAFVAVVGLIAIMSSHTPRYFTRKACSHQIYCAIESPRAQGVHGRN